MINGKGNHGGAEAQRVTALVHAETRSRGGME